MPTGSPRRPATCRALPCPTEATLHEEDTTPLALGTGAQGTGVLAVPMRSLFQTDSIAIRLSLYVTWAMVRTGMVQTIAAVTW